MKKLIIGALILGTSVLGVAFLAAAYQGDSAEAEKAELCDSLSDLSSTIMTYEGLNPATATNDELDQAADDIEAAWDDVEDNAYDWVYAYDNELTQAHDDLYYAIEDLPGDYTVAESLEALEPELSAFPQAFSETFDGSDCSTA